MDGKIETELLSSSSSSLLVLLLKREVKLKSSSSLLEREVSKEVKSSFSGVRDGVLEDEFETTPITVLDDELLISTGTDLEGVFELGICLVLDAELVPATCLDLDAELLLGAGTVLVAELEANDGRGVSGSFDGTSIVEREAVADALDDADGFGPTSEVERDGVLEGDNPNDILELGVLVRDAESDLDADTLLDGVVVTGPGLFTLDKKFT